MHHIFVGQALHISISVRGFVNQLPCSLFTDGNMICDVELLKHLFICSLYNLLCTFSAAITRTATFYLNLVSNILRTNILSYRVTLASVTVTASPQTRQIPLTGAINVFQK